ncbi:MAG: putative sulfate/molybdate transporter [Desulfotomaculaceae bacterium]|nr:putative sulfate/molybdate transporter [Desulfotomaculaceae bacterium]
MLVTSETKSNTNQAHLLGNRFDRFEWAGAFGDLGTLIPFVTGYITIMHMDPQGVLFMFGMLMIGSGLYYRTPISVQPMKAIGGAAIAQAATITPGMVWGAGIFTGLLWLALGLTGTLKIISKIITKPVSKGIVMGLGLLFMMEGIRMMRPDFILAVIALVIAFTLLNNKRFPVMFILVIFGVTIALLRDPGLGHELSAIRWHLSLPNFTLGQITWTEFITGALILGIPQAPLTLGNSVIATVEENNRLFPERPVTEKKIATSLGLLNLVSPLFGGIPVCHGAGGMAGHIRFGARTGGALIILGTLLLVTALFFSNSVVLIFKIFPASILGVILFIAGLELAVSTRDIEKEKTCYFTFMVTAGFSIWNIGAGFVAGLAVQELQKRKILKF